MVLTDDHVSTIEAAVEEGWGFDNLAKFITWILATNAGQGLVILVAVLLAQPLPELPAQALWINMTTAVLLGLTLAFEPKAPGLMTRPPRTSGAPILAGELGVRIVLVGLMLALGAFGLFEWALRHGTSEEAARSVAATVFAVGQSFDLLNCRPLRWSMFRLEPVSNPWIWAGISAMMLVQLAFIDLPVMNQLFHTVAIAAFYWLPILAVGLSIDLVMELETVYRRRADRRSGVKAASGPGGPVAAREGPKVSQCPM